MATPMDVGEGRNRRKGQIIQEEKKGKSGKGTIEEERNDIELKGENKTEVNEEDKTSKRRLK